MKNNAAKWNVFAMFILALAIAVFAWGLRSKLSLYREAGPTAAHTPVAKLLSNRERPADTVAQIEQATTPLITVVFASFTLFTGFLLLGEPRRQSLWIFHRRENPQRRANPPAARQILFRPPPSLR
ncbi:MAG: hypothetical protein ACRD3F_03250 [Acidobacteriaceae bacterium]